VGKALANLDDERARIEAAQLDPRRFAELYESHFDRVYAFVARRLRDRDAAQDVTAEVFHRALIHLPRFEWRGVPFSAWLLRMASNAIVDRSQRLARENGTVPVDNRYAESLEEVEGRAQLFRLVDTLPDDQRRVVRLRFAEQRSIREIAAALGRSEGAVKQLQFRGLENLRQRMGKAHG